MRRALALAGLALAAGGCGSHAAAPKPRPPLLPHALARAWARQADAIAASLAASDGCAAQTRVAALQQEIFSAVNAHRVPPRLLEPLSSGINDLAARITCAPPLVPTAQGNGQGEGHGRGKGKGRQKHGDEKRGGD